MRASGILMPIFSLESDYGIGTLGRASYEFVDFLDKAGQTYWQVLPINPISIGNSPYLTVSSSSGNPLFIDLDILCDEGLLKKEDYSYIDFGTNPEGVDYEKLLSKREKVLRIAFENFDIKDKDFLAFSKAEKVWLEDYSLFMALKKAHSGLGWSEWENELKTRKKEALIEAKSVYQNEMNFYKFVQFEFYKQWHALKDYANKKGIKIIGDIPIYVDYDSQDVWCNTSAFDLDKNYKPRTLAGCPPDAFSEDGQLWGTPVYNWERMKKGKTPYKWWRQRISHALKIFDVVRLDHFRGFEAYYCIENGAENAKNGVWKKGPEMDLFNLLREDYGKDLPIIAEDLGFLTPEVKKLLDDSGFPGMKVLQFAFDSREESDYLPHNYQKNSVVYLGTHDNDTVIGWTHTAPSSDIEFAKKYINFKEGDYFNWAMIKTALMSVSDTAIITMQDLIGLGSEGRINTPSTVGNNWEWRIKKGCINDWLACIVYENTATYSRLKKNK